MTTTRVWSTNGSLTWKEGNMAEFDDRKAPCTDAVAMSPDNYEYENAGDVVTTRITVTAEGDCFMELPTGFVVDPALCVSALPYLGEEMSTGYFQPVVDTSNWDLPQLYEAYTFPTIIHREGFITSCISNAFITACSWTPETDSTNDQGHQVVVRVSEAGVDQVGQVAKNYMGKSID